MEPSKTGNLKKGHLHKKDAFDFDAPIINPVVVYNGLFQHTFSTVCTNYIYMDIPVKVAVPSKSSISGAFPNLWRYKL